MFSFQIKFNPEVWYISTMHENRIIGLMMLKRKKEEKTITVSKIKEIDKNMKVDTEHKCFCFFIQLLLAMREND